jgi:P27 family predicted phage terminase small subunit
MGARGPLPRPPAAKIKAGNPGKHPIPTVQMLPAVPRPFPDPPEHLGTTGKAAWELVATRCTWVDPISDLVQVERYAQLTDERAELLEEIRRSGRTARGSTGQPVVAPSVTMLRQVEAGLLKLEAALVIGPSNRARVGLAIATMAEKTSKIEELLARRQERTS